MNTLETEFIETVASQVHPDVSFSIPTIIYIQSLLLPYAQAIDQATSVEAIKQWIPEVFPGELSKHALAEIDKVVRKLFNNFTDSSEAITAAKTAALEYIIAEIIEISGNRARRDLGDIFGTPWDVQTAILADDDLNKMFAIHDNKLPITAVVNGQVVNHELSEEFVTGLTAFEKTSLGDFDIRVFGQPALLPGYRRYSGYWAQEDGKVYKYHFTTSDDTVYYFNTPEFIQGFLTGAQWTGVDHRNYWTKFGQWVMDQDQYGDNIYRLGSDGRPISQPLTFKKKIISSSRYNQNT